MTSRSIAVSLLLAGGLMVGSTTVSAQGWFGNNYHNDERAQRRFERLHEKLAELKQRLETHYTELVKNSHVWDTKK